MTNEPTSGPAKRQGTPFPEPPRQAGGAPCQSVPQSSRRRMCLCRFDSTRRCPCRVGGRPTCTMLSNQRRHALGRTDVGPASARRQPTPPGLVPPLCEARRRSAAACAEVVRRTCRPRDGPTSFALDTPPARPRAAPPRHPTGSVTGCRRSADRYAASKTSRLSRPALPGIRFANPLLQQSKKCDSSAISPSTGSSSIFSECPS